jgi:hypothetical protein
VERDPQVIEGWRAAAGAKAPGVEVELAGPFQRHYTRFGTGLPPNFALVLTADEVVAFKFDPREAYHPLQVSAGQFKKEVARWPRAAVRVRDVDAGRLAFGLTLEAGGAEIPCRTPKMGGNPAAVAVIEALGGSVPA